MPDAKILKCIILLNRLPKDYILALQSNIIFIFYGPKIVLKLLYLQNINDKCVNYLKFTNVQIKWLVQIYCENTLFHMH